MDRWIVSFTNSLVAYVRKEMTLYHLYAVVTPLTRYFDTLTNVYIRFNRTRFKSDNSGDDRVAALSTLARVLLLIVRLMAPFTPFFCEYLWRTLRRVVDASDESVHFTMIPDADNTLIDESVERRMAAMRQVIDIGRMIREKKEISMRVGLLSKAARSSSAHFAVSAKRDGRRASRSAIPRRRRLAAILSSLRAQHKVAYRHQR